MKKYLVVNRQGEAMCATDDPLDAEQFKNRCHRPCWVFERVDSYEAEAPKLAHPTTHPGLAIASGDELDNFGRLFNLPRQDNETDSSYRPRLREACWRGLDRGLGPAISREEWLEQYTTTPRPTRDVVIDALLNNAETLSRQFLTDMSNAQLLDMAKAQKIDTGLIHALRRLVDEAPPQWIDHNGGPCPVRHEEVEVYCRGFHSNVTKRCWPESVNWHWNRPGVDATPIDVLKWRRV